MVWRCRNSAAANRRALHSDYTSATEKTPTPLNGRCTRPQNLPCFAPTPQCGDIARGTDTRDIRAASRKFPQPSKALMKSMFSRISRIRFQFRVGQENCIRSSPTTAQSDDAVSVLPRSKFFSTAAPAEASNTGHRDQKRANRVPSDSRRAAHALLAMRQSEAFGVRSRNTL
jgi:hypothetical protein